MCIHLTTHDIIWTTTSSVACCVGTREGSWIFTVCGIALLSVENITRDDTGTLLDNLRCTNDSETQFHIIA
jgi:hypothetical protein